MTQQIIDVGAAANDGTGEPLRQAFTAVNDNFTEIWTAGPVGSQVKISGNVITTTVTNLGLTLAGNGIGNIQANSTIVPGTSGVYDLGAPGRTFQYIYGDYLVGNGALITGIVANTSYNDSNVAAFLPTYTGNLVSLTGPVRTTANVIAGNIITSGFLGVTGAITGGNITGNNLISSGYISAVGNITTAGNISGNYLLGNGAFITGITATNIAAAALTGTTLSSNVLYSSLKVVDDLLYLDVVGNVTTQGRFIGSGAGLTNISAANITGVVANATYATIAGTAYSIAGANVSGTVANATYATTAGSATSANTATIATYANTANAVAGANVSGTVANATYATTASSATTANTATTAGTVTTAAQPNITSVGILTLVSVSGNATAGNILTGGKISAVGNIAGNYFIGNGSQLTGVAASNVSANALIGDVLSSNVLYSSLKVVDDLLYLDVIGNVTTSNYFIGNGSLLTGIVATGVGVLPSLSVTGNTQTGNLLTGGTVSATGNVSGNYFVGNGSQLTGIIASAGAAITNGNSNVTVNANGNVTVGVTGTSNVTVFAPTGAYIAGQVSATGNIAGNYLLGNGSLITGLPAGYSNADVANYLPTYTGNLVSLTGPVTTTSNITGGNVLTGGLVSATGNVSGNYILGNGALLTGVITSVANINNGTSNVTVVSSGGNITVGVGGTGNVAVFASTGEYVTGVVSASGNVIGGNVLTAGVVSATGNITGGNISTANLISTKDFGITGNITGNLIPSANVTYNIGNATNAFKDLYLSGNSIYLGTQTISSNATGITVGAGDLAGSNVAASNAVTAGTTVSAVGNITGGNVLTAGVISATGNATAGNVLTAGVVSATANITGGNILTVGLISATSTITSASNITGANLITSGLATVTGNVIGGNLLTGGLISATGNVIGGNVNTSNIQPLSGALTIATASGNLNLQPAGNIVLSNTIITGVAYPQQDTDAASKIYVDNFATTGISYHQPVAAATTTTLAAATSGTITYTQPNGVANGIGALLQTTGSFNLIDTANVQTVGTRVLVKNEANAVYNGVYTWSNATAIVRSTDADQYGANSTEELSINDYFFVSGGNVNAGSAYVVSAPSGTITFGTSNIDFSQFSSSQTYTANNNAGLSLVGTVFNAKVDQNTTAFDGGGNIIVKAGANLTTPNIGAATGTSISLTGNITGGNINTGGAVSATGNVAGSFFIGNGSQLTGVIASGGQGNTITLGTPTDGNLTQNVAYPGWTTATFVTDGLDDLNQVALNIANSTYVGNTYITANVSSGPSPLSVSLTGRYVGNPNAYLWQFGDGTANVTTANAIHTFSNISGGTFTVTYTAYNTNGTYNGNAANGAKGSTSTASTTITLYTPTPIPSFTANRTSLDTPGAVLITNTSLYAETYSINWGDGTIVIPANNWTTASHTFTNATANTDVLYGVNLTGNSANAGASPVSVTSSNTNVKVYSSQASNVFVTANRANVINGSGVISFRNDSNGAPGNTASFGAQQYYYFNYGDGNISNVVVASGTAGNPGAANVTNTFALSAANQSGNIYQQFTANLSLYTGYSTSPFKSGNITITVEPQTRANFVGTTANVVTDATANTGNARVGYLYTDYNGANRSTFTFQNTSENSNIANWTWGDSTFSNGVSNVGNALHTYTSTGAFTVSLQANGTPNGITSTAQSNTLSQAGYIFIAANPTAPTALSGFANLTIANASQGTSPLLAAGAADATGGNIPANGTSVTRFATTATITTSANVQNANTATTGTLTAYVNNTGAGNVTFTTSGNTVGTTGALVVSADRDLHVANAAVPSYFYKVFSANVSCALSSLSTGYNNYKMVHSVSGNTNYVGFVKDNLNTAPGLVTGNVLMVESTAGTYRYISGIPYYNTGSPAVTIANLEVSNLAGQTYTSTTPFTLASGTVYEGSGAVLSANQTKTLAQLDNAGNSMLTGSNVKANIGVSANYTFGNLTGNITGANNSVSTLQANILNVIGTGTTVQLPTKIQTYAGANSGVNEQSITCTPTANTQAAIRIVMSTAGNTPVFSDSTNYYTANAWSGAQTIAGTPEAVVRYGVLTQYAVDLSTGYLPVGPNLTVAGGRTSTQYFTFAFARPSLANFDIRLTTTTGVAGVWLAAPGTTIDKSGFSSPTPGFPGPTSTINGWLEAFTQYAGSGVPGAASGTGGNGSNGCALTGADVIPLNTAIANVGYTMTLGSQNAANSTGNNILIRIALASGQSITALSIGVAA